MTAVKCIVCAVAVVGAALAGGCRSGAPSAPLDGPAVFRMACVRCHGEEGAGDGPFAGEFGPVPDLRRRELGQRYDRTALDALLAAGRGKMPAHRDRLSAVDRATVADYVESHFMGRAPTPAAGAGPTP